MVVGVRDVKVVLVIEGDAGWGIQISFSGTVCAPLGQERARVIKDRDAVELLVTDVNPAAAIYRATGGPFELAILISKGAKVAVVLAIYVTHGHADPSGHVIQRTVHHVKARVLADGGIHRVVEPPALHDRHAQGHEIFQEFRTRLSFARGHYPSCGAVNLRGVYVSGYLRALKLLGGRDHLKNCRDLLAGLLIRSSRDDR